MKLSAPTSTPGQFELSSGEDRSPAKAQGAYGIWKQHTGRIHRASGICICFYHWDDGPAAFNSSWNPRGRRKTGTQADEVIKWDGVTSSSCCPG
jgi:hypothetical protein